MARPGQEEWTQTPFLNGRMISSNGSPWDGRYFHNILGKYNLPHSSHGEMDCKATWDLGLAEHRGARLLQFEGHHDCPSSFCPTPCVEERREGKKRRRERGKEESGEEGREGGERRRRRKKKGKGKEERPGAAW